MIKDNIYIFKRYFSLIKEDRKKLIPFYISALFGNILDLVIPFIISIVLDLITKGNYNNAINYLIILTIIYICSMFLSTIDCATYSNFLKCNYVTLHKKIVDKIYTFDYDYQKTIPKGRIINSINMDLIDISEMADNFYGIITRILKIIIILICFFMNSYLVGIGVLLLGIIYLLSSHYMNKKSAYYLDIQIGCSDKLLGLLSEVLSGLKDILSLNFIKGINHKFGIYRKNWQKAYITKRKYMIIQKCILKGIIYLGKILLFIYSIFSISKGNISIGFIILLVSYYDNFFTSTIEIMEKEASIEDENVSLLRIYKILEYKSNISKSLDIDSISSINGVIEFKNVNFSYEKQPTLKNISFIINPNCLTVLAGKTGSGKTTIFNLLLRLWTPNSGYILLDGNNINTLKREDYTKAVAIVNQDTFMFNLSIRQNLNLVNNNHKLQEDICKKIGIHNFIMSLDKGYDTILDENSTNLSGGQKRLLSLARVLLTDAKILLFDEVTSSLDPKTTDSIINILSDLKNDHTVIVITHKKELMKKADKLIIINKGRKVGEGIHTTLIKKNIYYKRLQNRK